VATKKRNYISKPFIFYKLQALKLIFKVVPIGCTAFFQHLVCFQTFLDVLWGTLYALITYTYFYAPCHQNMFSLWNFSIPETEKVTRIGVVNKVGVFWG
jgi:hypothetical protein